MKRLLMNSWIKDSTMLHRSYLILSVGSISLLEEPLIHRYHSRNFRKEHLLASCEQGHVRCEMALFFTHFRLSLQAVLPVVYPHFYITKILVHVFRRRFQLNALLMLGFFLTCKDIEDSCDPLALDLN
jgi:hypothetical protein